MGKEQAPGEEYDIEDFTVSIPNTSTEVEKGKSEDDDRVREFMARLQGVGSYIPGDDDLF